MKCATASMLLAAILLLGGCETARGLGKDMSKAGKWIEKKASK